ncbi:CPBP family intramembrane metalloprotease [Nodosilinea sp. LEGE 06152]|uniref:CPBP family intramembrane glutamic endopeptidase n=1 Tax=Nodosilinea sp. LEGE 06152 TaxID=2777966 RepID=UPI0018808D90|nr:CPBP family intramembrane glutamic endopeptidase [Nodosilinea sp. LEGE 06152]MBE9156692.1 CPBP family intramembrane metalloprotease [Nodosilinea sp. LEGE 06152]
MTVDVSSIVPSRPRFPLKILGLLLFISVFASFSTILYGTTVTHQAVSLLEILLIAGLLSAIITAPLAGLGLWSRSKQDIEDSSFTRLLVKDELIFSLLLAIALGILCGIFVVLSDKAFYSFLPTAIRDMELPGSLSGLLAAFGAGVNEEIWFRLGVLTGLIGLGRWLLKQTQTSAVLFWVANIVSTLLFGAAHLPQFALMANGLSSIVIGVVLFQNGIVGLIFGWLYWQRGLLVAMLAHITADIVIHVVIPTFFR